MATLIKEEHGLIYDEYFQESSLIWSLTPSGNDCLRFNPDGLRILHNDHYITYTMKEMEDPYCIQAHIDHVPVTEEDIGGIIIFSDTNTYAECQTYLAEFPSTIGNNGENVTAGYDLSARYVRYTFNDEEDESTSNSDSSSSSEEVINPTTGFHDTIYSYLKMIKYNNAVGHTYQFFASSDGDNWIEVGNVDYDRCNSIGFFLYATKDYRTLTRGNFTINSFYIYKNKYITINGITILQDFEIIDSERNRIILRSDTTPGINIVNKHGNRVQIDTTGLKLPLKNALLRIYSKGKYLSTVAQFTLDNLTIGGDIFSINYDIQLIIDNNVIESGAVYDIGELFVNSIKKNVIIYNNDDIDLANVTVSIHAFSEYYNGEEVIKIAKYQENMEDNPLSEEYYYTDSILIPSLLSHTGVEIVMKLSDVPKQEFYSVANKYRFKLIIE
jgi:hypothetical protein